MAIVNNSVGVLCDTNQWTPSLGMHADVCGCKTMGDACLTADIQKKNLN